MDADTRMREVARLLLEVRQARNAWDWLEGKPVDRKSANKFLLGCILDYQIDWETAWGNAARLAEEILGDPEDLWGAVTSASREDWNARWKTYRLHRFPAAHDRVWRIGREVRSHYDGDARNIWRGQSPTEVIRRLEEIGVGAQLSRMAVGGLWDSGEIRGKADVKADIHVSRVVGRVFLGRPATELEVTRLTREMHPDNPWLLDKNLFSIGRDWCHPTRPECGKCYLRPYCDFAGKAGQTFLQPGD